MDKIKRYLGKIIRHCETAYEKPNVKVDSYRCYFEGREQLAKEMLDKFCKPKSNDRKREDTYDIAIEYVKHAYCKHDGIGTEFMLIGDVANIIQIMSGKKVYVKTLIKIK